MQNRKKIIFAIIIGALIGIWAGNESMLAQYVTSTLPPPPPPPDTRPSAQPLQTPKLDLHFDVRPTIPRNYGDLQGQGEYAADLKDPSNITTVVEFDPEMGCYIVHTRLGDYDIVTPYGYGGPVIHSTTFHKQILLAIYPITNCRCYVKSQILY